jgi:hypothetical protein
MSARDDFSVFNILKAACCLACFLVRETATTEYSNVIQLKPSFPMDKQVQTKQNKKKKTPWPLVRFSSSKQDYIGKM